MTFDEAMTLARAEADAAAKAGDVPVGAVILGADGEVLARRHNERELRRDPVAHAELLAIQDAAAALGDWRLLGCTVVVTLEPCAMCAGAMLAARVARVVFGTSDPKAGAVGTLYNLCTDPRFNHEVAVTAGVQAEACSAQLSAFFAGRRAK